MPRVTKAMLEKENRLLRDENDRLRYRNSQLKELNEILKTKQFNVDAFCRMHAEAITSIAHVITDTGILIRKLR